MASKLTPVLLLASPRGSDALDGNLLRPALGCRIISHIMMAKVTERKYPTHHLDLLNSSIPICYP